MTSWHSYPKIYNKGHAATNRITSSEEVIIEEKVDGSQFSFGVFDGQLKFRSKGVEIQPDNIPKMFAEGIRSIEGIRESLKDGWMYSGEYLQKPKHNALTYDRIPNRHVILFDIRTGEEQYLSRVDKEREAESLGLEIVPLLYSGPLGDANLEELMDRKSILGGNRNIEGVVIKQSIVNKFDPSGKALVVKLVSETFREVHKKKWKVKDVTTGKDILAKLKDQYRNEARWRKAFQSLRDAGVLNKEGKDIPLLIKEVRRDIIEECELEILEVLKQWAMPEILNKSVSGLGAYYMQSLNELWGGE